MMLLSIAQLTRCSFFGILMICLSFRSVGTCSSSQIFLNVVCNMFVVAAICDVSTLGGKLSGCAAFLFFIYLMVILTSSFVGVVTSIGRSVSGASMFDGFRGAGQLKCSSMYSTHMFLCS